MVGRIEYAFWVVPIAARSFSTRYGIGHMMPQGTSDG